MMLRLTVADPASRLVLLVCDYDSEKDPQGKLWKISHDQAYQEKYTVENSRKEHKPEEHPRIVNTAYK